jgi:hypothetical protein
MWHILERIEKCTWFSWEGSKERDHSEDQGVDGRMGSELILGSADFIRLTQDRDQWWAVVSAVMNLRVLASQS